MGIYGYVYGYHCILWVFMGIIMGMEIKIKLTPEIVNYLTKLDEFKGLWSADNLLTPEELKNLKKVATIESVASSTRIEGVRLT
ncbi:hypothetical protein OAR19_00300 [bacterium]|nr:hypothetical protein [bacterium]